MVAVAFRHVAVRSFAEASAALAEHGDEARILAGGQSLLPMLNLRLARPSVLVDVNAVEAGGPRVEDGATLVLPALTRHQDVVQSSLVRTHCPALAEAVRHVGNVRVRARGTVGGSLAHGDPTAEISCVALAWGGEVVALAGERERRIPLRELFVTYLTTALEPDEVLTELRLPVLGTNQGWSFQELVRRASDFAVVGVAALATLGEDRRSVEALQVALVGVDQRPVLASPPAVRALEGGAPSQGAIAEAAAEIAAATEPMTDVHASAWYRRRLVSVLSRRAITEAIERAGGER